MTFGDWLKKTREAKRFSQTEIAAKAGVSKGYISNLERNIRQAISNELVRPKVETVDRIAMALDVPVDEARAEAGYAPKTDIPLRLKIEGFEGLDDRDIAAIEAFIKTLKSQKEK